MKRFNTTGKCIADRHYMVPWQCHAVSLKLGYTIILQAKNGRQRFSGYMVSFCFNKNKQPGLYDVAVGDRTICEAIV